MWYISTFPIKTWNTQNVSIKSFLSKMKGEMEVNKAIVVQDLRYFDFLLK